MKTTRCLSMTAAMAIAVCLGLFAPSPAVHAAFTPFSDDFESYSVDTFPSPTWAYNGSASQQIVSSEHANGGSQSMLLEGLSGTACGVTHGVSDLPSQFVLRASVYIGKTINGSAGRVGMEAAFGKSQGAVNFDAGYINAYNDWYYNNQTPLVAYQPNTWYHIVMTYDLDTWTYGVKINGIDYGSDFLVYSNNNTNPVRIGLSSGNGSTGIPGDSKLPTWFDDVSLTAVPEPATVALLVAGALLINHHRKR